MLSKSIRQISKALQMCPLTKSSLDLVIFSMYNYFVREGAVLYIVLLPTFCFTVTL